MCMLNRSIYLAELFDKLLGFVKYIVEVYAESSLEIKKDNKLYNQQP